MSRRLFPFLSPIDRPWFAPTLAGAALAGVTLAVWRTLPPVGTLVGGLLLAGLVAWTVALAQNARRQAEALRESQRFAESVAEHSAGILFVFDLDTMSNAYSNRDVAEFLGYSPSQIQEMGAAILPTILHPDDLPRVQQHLASFGDCADGQVVELEYRVRHVSGEWRWIWNRERIFKRREDGTPCQTMGTAQDITGWKRTENALHQAQAELEDRVRERTSDLAVVNEYLHEEIAERRHAEEALGVSEERYRFLADSMPQIVWTSRPDGVTDYYNRRWHEYTGLTLEETAVLGSLSVIHPADQEAIAAGWTRAMASGSPYAMEYRLKRMDGVYRWHLGRILPLRDESGQIVMWAGTGTDINDYKQAEEALRLAHDELEGRVQERTEALHQEQEFLRALLNNLQEGIVACDASGTLTVFNRATQVFHGLPPQPLSPADWTKHFDLYRADGQTPLPTSEIPLFRAWQGEIVRDEEMVIAPKSGKTRTLLANGQAIRDGQGRTLGAVVAMHDITERKEIDRLKNEFVSVVSHELRTPLTSILGALGLMAGGVVGDIPPPAQKLIAIAHANTGRLVRMINDILDIEKMEAGKMDFSLHPVPVLPLVRQVLDSLRAFAAQGQVTLTLDKSTADVVVWAESDRLMQVLTNLLSNAVKFSPPGENVSVTVCRQGPMVRVSVHDHGPGIPHEFQARVFQKFAQADSADTRLRGGSGLGLSICKGLVEKFGGHIGFETELGVGTTFHIDLQDAETPGEAQDGE